MKLFPKKLPAVPTGYEYFDLRWSQLIPAAACYLAALPRSADPAWATEQGLRYVAIALLKKRMASDELARTSKHSTLHRVRERHLRLMARQFQGQVLTFLGALVEQARNRYPQASPEQLLTVTRDAFRELLRVTFAAEDMSRSANTDVGD